MQQLLEMLSPDFILRNSLYASLILGLALPLIGVPLVVNNRTMLALALPEVSNLGVALAALLLSAAGWWSHSGETEAHFFFYGLAGAIACMLLAVGLIRQIQRLKFEGGVAESERGGQEDAEGSVLYAGAWAGTMAIAASNLLPELGLLSALRGELLAVSSQLLCCVTLGFAAVLALLFIFSQPLQLLWFDERIAYAQGLPTGKLQALNLGILCVSIAMGSLCTGPLAVFAFLIVPPVTVLPFVKNFKTLCRYACLLGLVCGFAGFYVSYTFERLNLPTATAQILCLVVTWITSKFYCWIKAK